LSRRSQWADSSFSITSSHHHPLNSYEIEIPEFETPISPPDSNILEPQTIQPPQTPAGHPQNSQISPPPDDLSCPQIETDLPQKLTQSLLKQWQIPTEYWEIILQSNHAEALLELPLPDRYLGRIIDNLYPRPIEEITQQREYILSRPEDLDRFVEGNLSAFLLRLDPEQEKLRDFGQNGPTLVKGGPGTGKSTLALYRVQTLLQQGCSPILFTTYTNALVSYSQQLLTQLLEAPPEHKGVSVSTVDALIYQYYSKTFGKPNFANEQQALTHLETALKITEIPGSNVFDRQVRRQTLERLGLSYLLQEFQEVIEGWGLTTLETYQAFERRGRGKPLKSSVREALWAVYSTWQTLMVKKHLITWPQLRCKALGIALQQQDHPYCAVVIDEAQDLSPVALRFLLALTPSLEKLYLTADASQSLYQRGFSWKQVHADLKVAGRTLILKRNYRNTAQISAACSAILQNTEAGDADCLTQIPSPHQGDIPAIVLTDSPSQEAQLIHTFLTQSAKQYRLPLHGGAILCPNSQSGQAIAQQLKQQGLNAEFVTGQQLDLQTPHIKVLTLHSAKGLEFPFVVITGLQEGQMPYLNPDLPSEEIPFALDEQRRLFYVGCSRAMRALMVCGSRSRPSPFLDTLTMPFWKR
jgi:superfamily I DNA/RNA helicase